MCNEWKTIETAPKDGTEFDVWCTHQRGYTSGPRRFPNCRYMDGVLQYKHSHGWFTLNTFEWSHSTITHWMPLPKPPTKENN